MRNIDDEPQQIVVIMAPNTEELISVQEPFAEKDDGKFLDFMEEIEETEIGASKEKYFDDESALTIQLVRKMIARLLVTYRDPLVI